MEHFAAYMKIHRVSDWGAFGISNLQSSDAHPLLLGIAQAQGLQVQLTIFLSDRA